MLNLNYKINVHIDINKVIIKQIMLSLNDLLALLHYF